MLTLRGDLARDRKRRFRPMAACCLLLLTAMGCVSRAPLPTQTQTAEVPVAWSTDEANGGSRSNSPTSLAQWWTHFDDPLLATLVEDALQSNTEIESAQAALRQARDLRDVVAAGLLPNVGSSGSMQHGTSGRRSTGTTFNAALDASWEIDVFGKNRSALMASDATVQASNATLASTQVLIAAEVALGYIALRSAQASFAIASENLATQLETQQIATWRLQAGLVSALEGEQANAAAEDARARLSVLRTSIEQTQHLIAVLTGRPPASLLSALSIGASVPRARFDLVLSIPADTLRQRPDVRAAEFGIAAAFARVAGADAARRPSFKLSGSLGLNALTSSSLSNGASVVSSLLAGVTMPIFNAGALLAQVRAEQAALERAQIAYRASVLNALQDVEDALIAIRNGRERVIRSTLSAEAASNAALYARQRFSSGIIDFQTVLETQRTQLGAQEGVVSAEAGVAADYVRLYKALGGGWRPDMLNTTPISSDLTVRTSAR